MSERAWEAHENATMPRFYFDLSAYKSYFDMGQPPWTPNLSAMYALDYALTKIIDEGVENVWQRHADIAQMTRDGIRELGLEVFPDESVASNTVTSVRMPDGVNADDLRKVVLDDHDVVLAGAYGELTGKMFRIGHLGYVTPEEIEDMLGAIKESLPKVGIGA